MRVQLRPNIYLGDKDAGTSDEFKADGITTVVIIASEMVAPADSENGVHYIKVGLMNGPNYSWVKDIACHIPKYLTQNGEVVLVQGVTGMHRAAFVAARAICELENKSIYEVFLEIKEKLPDLDLSKVYF